jgi:protein-disulfide isomerase
MPEETQHKRTVTVKVPNFMEMLVLILIVLVAANFYVTYNLHSKITGMLVAPSAQPQAQQPQEPSAPTLDISKIDLSKAQVKGKSTAKVTIVEYSDFQCSYCARAETQAVVQIIKDYVDTGKARFIFRQFPLTSLHQYAVKAAEAAECAGDQGKFWEMHDKLFANQQALDLESLKKYAADLGLDTTKFNTCLTGGTKQAIVQAQFNEGSAFGVSGTPTFFVNGKQIVGACSFDTFDKVLQAELAGKSWSVEQCVVTVH